ncbi:unnamed protein product [Oikopleura dioica]|uniref:Alpha-1,3-mannosyl-glycoprotein 2-beta-N-acetylglucosaminyltransferase n=1 Tax=Oikopleura dioica TaxID=34765 RepID=E4XIJ9_OIKDI|nr:unnamed protein product [Oikopleura dioica]
MALRTIPKLLLAIPAAAAFYLFVVWLLSRKLGIAESKSGPEKCSWTGEDALRRAQFCKNSHLSELFRNVCSCKNPMAITYENPVAPFHALENIPVLIIAADRPKYLLRCIYHLLLAHGVNKENIVVSIDGSYSETEAVATLFGIRSFQSKSEGTKSARVSRHYRRALKHVMQELYPRAPSLIIIEDDLQVAPDFFYYFEHLLPMLEDDDIYCISAWNDHGMEHAVHSPEAVYRVDGMPGLGWATSRKIVDELLPKWLPKERFTDWDIWMRQPAQRRGRQCLIPDISRTFHFGEDGLNVNSKMQGIYFRNHAIFKEDQKVGKIQYRSLEKLSSSAYDDNLKVWLNTSKVILPSDFECAPGLKKVPFFSILSNSQDKLVSFILYFKQDSKNDLDDYLRLCWCLNIWDLDSRANYKGVTRIHLQEHQVFLVGYPYSEFSNFAKPNEILSISQEIPAGNRRYKH